MRKIIFVAFVAIATVLGSCQKIEDIDVTLKQSGVLSITVKDSDGNPIKDKLVSLYLSSSVLEVMRTDDNGVVNFGELIQNVYSISIEEIEISGKKYLVNQNITVTAGTVLNYQVNPQEYIGSVEFTASETIGDVEMPLEGVTVMAVPYEYRLSSLSKQKTNAIAQGVTDASGEAMLSDISSGYSFFLLYYENEVEPKTSSSMLLSKLGKVKYDGNFAYYNTTLTFEPYYSSSNVVGINVLLVDDADYYYNDTFDEQKAKAKKIGITNNLGVVEFSKVSTGSYTVIYQESGSSSYSTSYYYVDYYSTEKKITIY